MDRTEVLGSFRILRQQDLWQRQSKSEVRVISDKVIPHH